MQQPLFKNQNIRQIQLLHLVAVFSHGNTTQVVYTDASGTSHTIDYSFDSRDRLITEARSEGDTLNYSFDTNGNRTQVRVELRNGETLTTDYSFDALNRLATVTDNAGGVTTYSYDANGNRTLVAHANGTTQSYSYDSLNRLTSTEISNASGPFSNRSPIRWTAPAEEPPSPRHLGAIQATATTTYIA